MQSDAITAAATRGANIKQEAARRRVRGDEGGNAVTSNKLYIELSAVQQTQGVAVVEMIAATVVDVVVVCSVSGRATFFTLSLA